MKRTMVNGVLVVIQNNWTCESCTFSNKEEHLQCDMCHHNINRSSEIDCDTTQALLNSYKQEEEKESILMFGIRFWKEIAYSIVSK